MENCKILQGDKIVQNKKKVLLEKIAALWLQAVKNADSLPPLAYLHLTRSRYVVMQVSFRDRIGPRS